MYTLLKIKEIRVLGNNGGGVAPGIRLSTARIITFQFSSPLLNGLGRVSENTFKLDDIIVL